MLPIILCSSYNVEVLFTGTEKNQNLENAIRTQERYVPKKNANSWNIFIWNGMKCMEIQETIKREFV